MWGVFDTAQDGMAGMNTPAVLKQTTWDCSSSCDNRSTLTRADILTELQVLNLIIMLSRGVGPMKGKQVWKKRHGNMLKPNYNLKSTNTCHPTCYLFLPDLSSSDLEMRKGSKSFTRSNNVWCEIVSVAERLYFWVALFSSLSGDAPWTSAYIWKKTLVQQGNSIWISTPFYLKQETWLNYIS